MALAVMVPLVLGAATGLLTALRASATAQEQQRLQVALTNATEVVRELPYERCASPDSFQRRLDAPDRSEVLGLAGPGPERHQGERHQRASRTTPVVTVGDVAYWSTAAGTFVGRCTPDEGAQRVTVTVTDGDRSVTGTTVTRSGAPRRGPSR